MRLWSLHPRYLDAQGLVALWREALLAQAVLAGKTRGYRFHPQLDRFKAQAAPLRTLRNYLLAIHAEASERGYAFDRRKIGRSGPCESIAVTTGQVRHEWQHLMNKLEARSPSLRREWRTVKRPDCHPLFKLVPGPIEPWER